MVQDLNFKPPKLEGTNYSYWKEIMEFHLESLLKGIWEIIKIGYTTPQNGPPQTLDEVRDFENNTNARVAIFIFLSDEVFGNFVGLKTTK